MLSACHPKFQMIQFGTPTIIKKRQVCERVKVGILDTTAVAEKELGDKCDSFQPLANALKQWILYDNSTAVTGHFAYQHNLVQEVARAANASFETPFYQNMVHDGESSKFHPSYWVFFGEYHFSPWLAEAP